MIRRSTVVYLVLLLALVGTYLYLHNRAKPADLAITPEPSSEVSYLFTANQGTPSSIRVESNTGKTVEITGGGGNAWTLTQPIEAKADQGAAEAAASQVTTMRVIDKVPNVDLKVVGLDVPAYTLTIKFAGGAEQKVDIGVPTPTESGYYVRDASGKVVIVSKDSVDALIGLLDNPPYAETLTPSPTVVETGTPSPASQTPEAGGAASASATP